MYAERLLRGTVKLPFRAVAVFANPHEGHCFSTKSPGRRRSDRGQALCILIA
jgi:hypothetical protein